MSRNISVLSALSAVALIATLTLANAAGITKTLKFTMPHTSLGGYVSKPVSGYTQEVKWGKITPTTFYALVYDNTKDWPGNLLGDPAYLNIIGPTGNILSIERLPAAMQPTKADCRNTNPYKDPVSYDGCPQTFWASGTINQFPGKLAIQIQWQTQTASNVPTTMKFINYILDTAAPVGSKDRWTFLYQGSTWLNSDLYPLIPATVNVFDTSNGVTKVYTITNK